MVLKTCRFHILLFFLCFTWSATGTSLEVLAAQKKQAKLTLKEAKERLRSGYDALQAQKPKDAASAFSQALRSGHLSRNEIARALYYRGQAYRLLKKPANAIADFNGAIWLENALSKRDRAEALKMRDAAYNDAGIGRRPSSSNTASIAAKPSSQPSIAQPSIALSTASDWQPTETNANSDAAKDTNSFGSFFGGLFTPGSNNKNSTAPSQNPPTRSASSAWTSSTQAASPPVVRKKPVKTLGAYVIQIASLRSAAQARTLARKITREHAGLLQGRKPQVESQVVGNMGVFYHVRIRQWPSKAASRQLCKKLLATGLDCLVSG